ncbi:MAG: hypothetical protein WBR14_02020 [Candidatus Acidiferrum sp.]
MPTIFKGDAVIKKQFLIASLGLFIALPIYSRKSATSPIPQQAITPDDKSSPSTT